MNIYEYITALERLPTRYKAKQLKETHILRVGASLVVAHPHFEPLEYRLDKGGVWQNIPICAPGNTTHQESPYLDEHHSPSLQGSHTPGSETL